MKADLTRNTFDHLKHYTRVLMQQGRVQLDSDWNEQVSILLHYLCTLAADLIGPAGGPKDHYGFEISALMPKSGPIHGDFRIGLGRYYVDGFLCEAESMPINIVGTKSLGSNVIVKLDTWSLDGDEFQQDQFVELFDADPTSGIHPIMAQIIDPPDKANQSLTLKFDDSFDGAQSPKLRRVITYKSQPDYPSPANLANGSFLVYLDVWERHITYVEDDHIREVALGGPDTTTRTKLVWQVRAKTDTEGNGCKSQLKEPENRGRLKARAKQNSPSTAPCIISPEARYTGPENQLYRVEIHTSNLEKPNATPTFKWSRENGAVVFPIVSGGDTNEVTLETLGRDDRFGLTEGDWVEVQDDWSVLHNQVGNLLQVQSIDLSTMTVTLSGTPNTKIGGDPTLHPLLRRWDQKEGDSDEDGLSIQVDGAAMIEEGKWLTLEDGVQIQFQTLISPNVYRTGDYWVIPARTATGDVEWPKVIDAEGNQMPIALPPEGINHHYAPLRMISVKDGVITINGDCRCLIEPKCP